MQSKPFPYWMVRHFIVLAIISITACTKDIQQQNNPRQLRVLTYNIHHGEAMDGKFDYQRLAKVITDCNPDVVALQEVDRKTRRADSVDQVAILAQLTGLYSAFGNALYYQGGEYGEALFSRFPLENPKAHHLPFRPGQEPRTALAALIKPTTEIPDFIFVGTHLCHQSNETRTEQAQQINRLFPENGGPPIILAGDLNARIGSDPMNVLLAEHWSDATAPQSRIDYVLIRNSDPWRIMEVKTIDEQVVSDHRPVLVVLEWLGEK
jgi:endonuclease/exonuclease/phosphatase family metal-dependent hydrolase